jgi:hypothetical protein
VASRPRLDEDQSVRVERSKEAKASSKSTEFMACVAMLAGIFVAGAVTKASGDGGVHDVFWADRVWLYAMVLTVGYMVSRGLAKPGSPDYYTDER